MQRANFLDLMLARFRHRWETDRQYRAAMSGLIGLVTVIGMCACTGLVSYFANGALSGSGLTAGSTNAQAASGNNGQVIVQGVPQFPTQTIPTWAVPQTPISNPVPVSQTPAPTPTPLPTATPAPTDTPCVSNCGGGGGGGGNISASGSPNPWIACPPAPAPACDKVSIHTSVPYNGINILITYCNNATILNSGATTTDANGNATWSFYGPATAPGSPKAVVTVQAQSGVNTSFTISCA